MSQIIWKGKPFKSLSFGKNFEKAGRNFSGRITIFHRGGGRKKLYRRIDYERKNIAQGIVERVEYDPNRTARIALIRWSDFKFELNSKSSRLTSGIPSACVEKSFFSEKIFIGKLYTVSNRNPNFSELLISLNEPKSTQRASLFNKKFLLKTHSTFVDEKPGPLRYSLRPYSTFSYILAWEDIKSGDEIFNFEDLTSKDMLMNKNQFSQDESSSFYRFASRCAPSDFMNSLHENHFSEEFNSEAISIKKNYQKKGVSMPLHLVPLGSMIYNIELQPGKGGQLVRAAGAYAQLIKKDEINTSVLNTRFSPSVPFWCFVRMPSGQQQRLDLRCRVTIGNVSNVNHGTHHLKKAGQKRWLGFRPVVRGVAMNPIDHPHGGGEGRTKGGRPSVSPWGKPSKCGFRSKRLLKSLF